MRESVDFNEYLMIGEEERYCEISSDVKVSIEDDSFDHEFGRESIKYKTIIEILKLYIWDVDKAEKVDLASVHQKYLKKLCDKIVSQALD